MFVKVLVVDKDTNRYKLNILQLSM